jgi:hypothetical protein
VKRYLRAEIERFLKAVDSALRRRVEVVVIGGAAASICYHFEGATADVDTWTTVQKDLAAAVSVAHETTGLRLPLRQSSVAVRRFQTEMGAVIGSPARLRGNFLTMVERVFPGELDATEQRLGRPYAQPRPRRRGTR